MFFANKAAIFVAEFYGKNKMRLINKIFVLALLLLPAGYSFAEETYLQKVQNILNDKTIADSYNRWGAANEILLKHAPYLPFEEAMSLYTDVLLPFAEKNIKDDSRRNIAKAVCYSNIAWIYLIRGEAGDLENEEVFRKKAIEFADLSGNDARLAEMYSAYAELLSRMGNIPLAHEYYYAAINLYESINSYAHIISCLVGIAENLSHTRDVDGLRRVIEQMRQYMEQPTFDADPYSLTHFYSVQATYYGILSEDNPEITAYNDSTLTVIRNTIRIIEDNIEAMGRGRIGFSYYNMSLTYRRCYPDRYDSIYYFLDKSLELKNGEKYIDIELEICAYILYAELHFEQKRYQEAEKDMLYALSLLDQVQDDNVTAEYFEAYSFLVMYYETMNRPAEALKYHKLLLENEKRRYDSDKINAMADMLVKYESEKKKERIDRLTEENKKARYILTLSISTIILLLIGVLILIHLYRLKKKNYELSIYESAMFAELKQTELEQFKQHLEQKTIKTLIKNLTSRISEAYIEKPTKRTYIQKLSELDIDMLEQGYLTVSEKISNMDMKYIICFAIDMDVKDMSLIFNVEPASIRSVRYRLKKKFGVKNTFKFLL